MFSLSHHMVVLLLNYLGLSPCKEEPNDSRELKYGLLGNSSIRYSTIPSIIMSVES